MTNKITKIPQIRFNDFTEDWEQRKLGDHSKILTGGTPKTQNKEYWEPKEIPWMSSGEINKKRLFYTDNKISILGFENSSARWIKEKSVLIALAGQGKTRGTVAINEIPLTTNQSIASIEPDNTLNSEFLFQNLENRYEELRLVSSGDGSRGGLNKRIISDILIKTPFIREQEKIGKLFKQLDDNITLHLAAIQRQQDLKKAMLQKLFPINGGTIPTVRFSPFTEEWEQRKLGLIFDILDGDRGKNYPNEKDFFSSGPTLFLDTGNVRNTGFKFTNCKFISKEKNSTLKSGELELYDFVITSRGTLGNVAYYDNNVADEYPSIRINSAMLILRPKLLNEISNDYILSVLRGNLIEIFMKKNHVGSAQPHITKRDFVKLDVNVPKKYEEQTKIGNFFKQLDETVTLHQRKLEFLKQMKKSLLQKMFV